MTAITKQELLNHLGKEITVLEGGKKTVIVFEKLHAGWIQGYCQTYHSLVQIFLDAPQDEHSPKYFLS